MERREFQIVESGTWDDVASFCETLSEVFDGRVTDRVRDRFEDWRPKPEESKRELREKTAEEASVTETAIEKESDGPVTEMAEAGHEVKETGKDMMQGDPQQGMKDAEHAGSAAAKGIIPPFIQLFRIMEELLYTHVVGRTNPNYFESGTFTVCIERDFLDRTTYQVRVIFDDTDLMDTVWDDLQHRQYDKADT